MTDADETLQQAHDLLVHVEELLADVSDPATARETVVRLTAVVALLNRPETQAQIANCEALHAALRDNLSPEGVATIIAFLQPATMQRPATEEQRKALCELEWFVETLMNLIGVEGYNRLLDELSL